MQNDRAHAPPAAVPTADATTSAAEGTQGAPGSSPRLPMVSTERRTVVLPSGAAVQLRPVSGGDLVEANASAVRSGGGQFAVFMELVLRVAEIDGEPLTSADLTQASGDDVLFLVNEVGGVFAFPAS